MANHNIFTSVVIFAVALFIGLYFQRHFDIIPDLSSATPEEKSKQSPHISSIPDESGWNKWQHIRHWPDEGASWPSARLAHASCSVGDNDMYVFGGLQGGTTPDTSPPKVFNDLWRYDEFHDRWYEIHPKQGSPVPAPRLHHTLVPAYGGKKLVLFGGFDDFVSNPNHKAIDDGIWIFDINDKSWENIAPAVITGENKKNKISNAAPSARGSHEMVSVGKYDLYLFGGFAKIGVNFDGSDELWKFNLQTKTWKKLGDSSKNDNWPEGRIGFPMISLESSSSENNNNKQQIYLFGGGCKSKGQCNDEWILEVSTADSDDQSFKWTKLATTGSVPSPRRAPHADVNVHGKVFLFGGMKMSVPPAVLVEESQLSANEEEKEKKPSSAPVPSIFDDFYVLDLKTLQWTKIEEGTFGKGTRPPPVFGHTCVKVRDKIVLFGGRTSTIVSPGSSDVWEFWFSEN